jgi:hypothetical protein
VTLAVWEIHYNSCGTAGPASGYDPEGACDDPGGTALAESWAWLFVAVVAGLVLGYLWIKRELWIHRRRRRGRR